jgi:L-aspartate oxidase
MGSNSLLEGLVVGQRAGALAAAEARALPAMPLDRDLRARCGERSSDVRVGIQDMTYSLKSLMWRELGIVRRGPSMEEAVERIAFWTRAVLRLARPEPRAFELLNMLTLSRLIAHAALYREESRGTHYREDCPAPSDEWLVHTVVRPVVEGAAVSAVELSTEPVATLALR